MAENSGFAAAPQRTAADDSEQLDPIRTMQKDIAMLQRGEYKPRVFADEKVTIPVPPPNPWEDQNRPMTASRRIEDFQPEAPAPPPGATEAQASAIQELNKELARGNEIINRAADRLAYEPPPISPATAPQSHISISEIKSIAEFDILNLSEEHIRFAAAAAQKTADRSPFPRITPVPSTASVGVEPPVAQAPPQQPIFIPSPTRPISGPPEPSAVPPQPHYPTFVAPPQRTIDEKEGHDILSHALTAPPEIRTNVFEEPAASKRKIPLRFLLVFFLVILIIGGGALGIFFFLNRAQPAQTSPEPQPSPQPSPAPHVQEIPIPQSFIGTNTDTTIEATSIAEAKTLVAQHIQSPQAERDLFRLLVKINSEPKRYLTFEEMLQIFDINLPFFLRAGLDMEAGTLFTYTQPEGTRLGFVARIKDTTTAQTAARSWETTAPQDTAQLFALLGAPGTLPPAEFSENSAGSAPIRYLNFAQPDLSIDYTFTETLFVFTTSRASMGAALTALGR